MTLSPIHARIHAEYRHASCVMQITHTPATNMNRKVPYDSLGFFHPSPTGHSAKQVQKVFELRI